MRCSTWMEATSLKTESSMQGLQWLLQFKLFGPILGPGTSTQRAELIAVTQAFRWGKETLLPHTQIAMVL